MSTDEIMQLVANALNVSLAKLCMESQAGDFEEWDSMGLLGLLAMLDRQGISFDPGNIATLQSVRDVVQVFRKAGK